jgi:hypothetical protein
MHAGAMEVKECNSESVERIDESWILNPADKVLIASKSRSNRWAFALLLLFFRSRGRFPRQEAEIDAGQVAAVAQQLDVAADAFDIADMADRSLKRHRAEIRALFGFREATAEDGESFVEWLRDHAVASDRDIDSLTAALEQHCQSHKIEPPAIDRMERITRAALSAYDERFCAGIHSQLSAATRAGLDAMLRPANHEGAVSEGDDAESSSRALILELRSDAGRPAVSSLQAEMAKLNIIRQLGMAAGLFDHARPHEIDQYRQRVAVEAPYELRRHAEPIRLTALAAFAYLRGRSLTDSLVDLLIETIHQIGSRAERRVDRELLNDLKRVTGKQNILFELADASLAQPDGVVRDVVFPAVGEQTLRDLVKEWKATGPAYRQTLRTVIRNSYSGHYRRMVPELLNTLTFHSNNAAHQPVIRALDLIRRHAGSKLRTFPTNEDVPLEGVVHGLWREAILERNGDGPPRVNRITYEICVLEALREQLRCKEIWVVGADRYRNPDEDLPADFEAENALL